MDIKILFFINELYIIIYKLKYKNIKINFYFVNKKKKKKN